MSAPVQEDQRGHASPATAATGDMPVHEIIREHIAELAGKYTANFERVIQSRWRHRYYYRRLSDLVGQMVLPGARVLDIGCLRGDMLAAVKPSYGVGIDICERAIASAQDMYPHLHFRVLAGEDVAGLNEKFDYVILSNVIGEMYDFRVLLEALRTVCGPHTRLVISSYSRVWQPVLTLADWLRSRTHLTADNWLPPDEVDNMLHLSDFEVIRRHSSFLLPLGVPLLAEFFNRWVSPLPLINQLCLQSFCVARLRETQRLEKPCCSVSVVIPARNEAGHVKPLLERIPPLGTSTEVIFIEGHSTDDTWETIQQVVAEYEGPFEVRCMRQGGKGKGDAVRQAFAAASKDILMILDADISVPPEELPQFVRALEGGYAEFVNGSRLVYPMDKRAMRFLNLLGNKFFGYAFTFLLGQRFRDTLCGTKVISRRNYEVLAANRSYFGEFDPFGDFDLLFGAARLNLKIADVPVHYKERVYGETNISRFSHGWLLLKMCAFAARKIKFI